MINKIWERGKKAAYLRQRTVMGASVVIFVATLSSAFLGIWRNRVLSGEFYSCCTAQLDVYTNAFRIPDMLFSMLVMGAFSASFIPVFAQKWAKNRKEAHKMASVIISVVLLAFLVLTGGVLVFSRGLSSLVAPGFSLEQIELMARLMRIMMLSQIFFALSNFMTAILQARQRFLVSAFSPVVYNLSIIFGAKFFSGAWGIYAPTIGVVVGAFLHLLIQVPVVLKLGFVFKPSLDIRTPGVGQIAKLTLPRSFSLGLGQMENMIAAAVASTLPIGSVFIFNLAYQLMQLPTRLFGATIGQAALPTFAKAAAKKGGKTLEKVLREVLLQAFYISLPASAIFLVLRLPLVRVAFGARKFPWEATLKTKEVLAWFAPAIFAQSGIQILVRAYYAQQNTKTPLFTSLSALLANILTASILVFGFGWKIEALSLGISVGALIQLFQLFAFLRIKDKKCWLKELFVPLVKISYASFLASASSWLLMHYLDHFVLDTAKAMPTLFLTGVAALGGGLIYLLATYLLNINLLSKVWEDLTRSFKNGRKKEVVGEVVEMAGGGEQKAGAL